MNILRIPRFSWDLALAVWSRNAAVYRKTYKLNIVPNFFEPVFFLVSMGLGVGSYIQTVEGQPYRQYIAPGLLASQAMMGATCEVTYNCFVKTNFGKGGASVDRRKSKVERAAGRPKLSTFDCELSTLRSPENLPHYSRFVAGKPY